MALTGNEILYVQGVDATGRPAATTQQTTTSAIAALANGDVTSEVNTNITTVGNGVLTAAGLVGGLINRTGPTGAYTDTTATAAQIYALVAVTGVGFYVRIKNGTAFTQTIAAGTGITLPVSVVIPPNSVGTYLVSVVSTVASTLYHVSTVPLTDNALEVITALTTVGAGTITAAGIAGGNTTRGGSQSATPFTDTTDTATNIIAAQPNAHIGLSWEYTYINNTNASATLTGGTGVTVSAVTVVPPNGAVIYLVTYTAAATITMAAKAKCGFSADAADATKQIAFKASGATTGKTATIAAVNTADATYTLPAATDTLAGIATAQTWTAVQTFTNSDVKLLGSSTGATTFTSANAGATNYTATVPAWTDTIGSGNGGRVTAQLSKTTDTALAGITGMTASLVAGGTYKVHVYLPTTSGASGGVKVALNTSDTLSLTSSNITATLNTASASAVVTTTSGLNTGLGSTAAVTLAIVDATLVVNAAGTLTVTFAQNASDGTASIALVNGHVYATRIA